MAAMMVATMALTVLRRQARVLVRLMYTNVRLTRGSDKMKTRFETLTIWHRGRARARERDREVAAIDKWLNMVGDGAGGGRAA